MDFVLGKTVSGGKSQLRRSDFVARDGTYTRAQAQRLRRLERTIRERLSNFISSEDYQLYTPTSQKRRRELDWMQPDELRRFKLPFLVVRTGQRQVRDARGRRVFEGNSIQSIRAGKGKSAKITLRGGARPILYLPVKAQDWVRDPGAVLARLLPLAKGMKRPRFSVRVGFSVINRRLTPDQLAPYLAYMAERYTDTPHDWQDFFEGLTLQETA